MLCSCCERGSCLVLLASIHLCFSRASLFNITGSSSVGSLVKKKKKKRSNLIIFFHILLEGLAILLLIIRFPFHSTFWLNVLILTIVLSLAMWSHVSCGFVNTLNMITPSILFWFRQFNGQSGKREIECVCFDNVLVKSPNEIICHAGGF